MIRITGYIIATGYAKLIYSDGTKLITTVAEAKERYS